MVINGLNLEE